MGSTFLPGRLGVVAFRSEVSLRWRNGASFCADVLQLILILRSLSNFAVAGITAAAIDRIVHHSVILELNLSSYRMEAAKNAKGRKQ